MITTPMKAVSARVNRGSGPNTNQTTNVAAAVTRTAGTKISRDPVRQALDRGLGALRALDQLHDPGEGRVAPDARRAHDERARGVDGGADDLVARALRGRDRLAGEHRLVDGGHALDHDAVDRHLVAGPDPQEVARDDDREVHVLLDPVADAPGGGRLEAHEAPDRPGRAALRAGLEPLPQQDQAEDDRRRSRSRSPGASPPRG